MPLHAPSPQMRRVVNNPPLPVPCDKHTCDASTGAALTHTAAGVHDGVRARRWARKCTSKGAVPHWRRKMQAAAPDAGMEAWMVGRARRSGETGRQADGARHVRQMRGNAGPTGGAGSAGVRQVGSRQQACGDARQEGAGGEWAGPAGAMPGSMRAGGRRSAQGRDAARDVGSRCGRATGSERSGPPIITSNYISKHIAGLPPN